MRTSVLALSLPAFLFTACSPDSPIELVFSPPTCAITEVDKIDASFPEFAKIKMTVENTGDATAFDAGCSISLKIGNTIIERGAISFGTLSSGEACRGEAWFSQIRSHSEYDYAEYYLSWYDAEGNFHDSYHTVAVKTNKEVAQ